jgi:hypothetical protein
MPSRPSQGGSTNTWGAELNAWLDVAHNADGTLKSSVVSSAIGGSVSAAGDVTLAADADADAAGDLIFRTGGVVVGMIVV